jgi:hypothetical protein
VFAFSVFPLRLASFVGLILASSAGLYATYIAIDKYLNNRIIEGWASLMVAVLFTGGINLIFMGILGEYLGKTFMETKRRPLYVISHKLE